MTEEPTHEQLVAALKKLRQRGGLRVIRDDFPLHLFRCVNWAELVETINRCTGQIDDDRQRSALNFALGLTDQTFDPGESVIARRQKYGAIHGISTRTAERLEDAAIDELAHQIVELVIEGDPRRLAWQIWNRASLLAWVLKNSEIDEQEAVARIWKDAGLLAGRLEERRDA